MAIYEIYADGACSGNPGPGGWAFEIWQNQIADGSRVGHGADMDAEATNNRMELAALAAALEAALALGGSPGDQLHLCLDSEYALKGLFEWLPAWKRRGWRTGANKPVSNREAWQRIDGLAEQLRAQGIDMVPFWRRGHTGDTGNERVDARAGEMRDQAAQGGAGAASAPSAPAAPDPASGLSPVATVADADSTGVTAMQIALMDYILARHAEGSWSTADVIRQIRDQGIALGLVARD